MLRTLFFSTLFFFIFLGASNAQQRFTIQGTVLEAKDSKPIPFVNVFLEGTTIGTQSDSEGNFQLKNIPAGTHNIVASMVGYAPFEQKILVSDKNIVLPITLAEDIKVLREVKIVGKRDKIWEKQYQEFEKDFLGKFDKKKVIILNKEVIDFEKTATMFSAKATQPIIIENRSLGYKQFFILQGFEKDPSRIAYKGLGRYELLEAKDEKEADTWNRNRVMAYRGSLKHFLKSLVDNSLQMNNFKVFRLDTNLINTFRKPIATEIFRADLVSQTSNGLTTLALTKKIQIIYEIGKVLPQYSEIKPLSEVLVFKSGDLLDPYSLEIKGKMGEKGIASTLPFDFEMNEGENTGNVSETPMLTQYPPEVASALQQRRENISNLEDLKPYYLAGETVKWEFFVADFGGLPSQISVPLYVELIDLAKGKLLERYTMKLQNGKAKLSIFLPSEFATGQYQVRAYTNWMRNFSETAFFRQNITVFSQNYKKEIPISSNKPPFDSLTVHIEGGYLVDGLKSKIVIETKDSFWAKMSVPFQIISAKNDTLINATSDSLGLSMFDFTPKTSENYQIVAKNKTFQLPKAQTKGTVFTVDNLSNAEKLRVFVQTNNVSTDTLTLALIKDGQLVYWKSFQNSKPSLLINIPKSDLNGTIQCFLMDKKGKTLGERTIEISADEPSVEFLQKDRFLLTKMPFHFLDFDKNLTFTAEQGLTLKGKLSRMNGKAVKKEVQLSMVLTVPKNDSTKANTKPYFTNCKDTFTFQNLDFYGKRRATFVAPDNVVVLDTVVNIPEIIAQKLPINWKLVDNLAELDALEKRKNAMILANIRKSKENILLEEVVVKAKKLDPNAVNGISPNVVLEEKRIITQPSMSSILRMLMIPRERRFGSGLKVFIDSQELRKDDIDNIDFDISPSIVEKVLVFEEIIPPTYGMRAACVIAIVLRRGFNYNFKPNESFIVQGYHQE